MRIFSSLLFALLLLAGISVADTNYPKSGGTADPCFTAQPIPDSIWRLMQGKTYTDNPYIQRSDLRYLRVTHHDGKGNLRTGELVCNKAIAEKLLRIFRALYDAGYPIERIQLPEKYNADDEQQMRDNNTSCFCYRPVAGSAKLSKHAMGLAIDINPLYNPYYKDRANGTRFVQPATARKYCDRTKNFPYKITKGDLCYRLFTEAGFQWGGNWRSVKDFQHFEMQ